MFIAGLRKLDRVRGSGWLDCPNCHEHAAQDVVDEMRFATLAFYRFTPVSRLRILRCRRCGYRRPATPAEMGGLHTAGLRVARAWLAPVGLAPFGAALIVAGIISLHNTQSAQAGTSYVTLRADPIAPVSMAVPSTFSANTGQAGVFEVSSGNLYVRLHRYPVDEPAADILGDHLGDDVDTFHATGFPDKPPSGTTTKIAGAEALRVTIDYEQLGGGAILDMYAFNHGGVSYILSFQVTGGSQSQIDDLAPHVLSSLTFTSDETPAPTPQASPTPTPESSPSASGSPAATGSATSSSSSS
ncbi:MAG TPA: hypothetical protein VFO60_10685 [Candidatus Dormibacteraeota bacterium]|nr:hypothetical protein [Candidatus Dormibacteraeota bacterium]